MCVRDYFLVHLMQQANKRTLIIKQGPEADGGISSSSVFLWEGWLVALAEPLELEAWLTCEAGGFAV